MVSWRMEALVFSTNFRLGFDVEEFQTILPKNYIHHVVKGEPIYDFFEAWKRSAAETSHAKTYGLQSMVCRLRRRSTGVPRDLRFDLQKKWLSKGCLIWEIVR